VFGKGRSDLLKAINETGSLSKACRKLNMSYRRAWSYISSAEDRLGKNFIIKARGGKDGGGAVLTGFAEDLIKRFDKLDEKVKTYTEKLYKKIF
jgi:molybdate transport system regulatory protein